MAKRNRLSAPTEVAVSSATDEALPEDVAKPKKRKAAKKQAQDCSSVPDHASAAKRKDPALSASASEAKKSRQGHELTVFVGDIPAGVEEKTIREDFEVCGEIKSLKYSKFKRTAFITFQEAAAVEKALEYNGEDYGGKPLRVQISRSGADSQAQESGDKNSLKVYVGGIPWGTDDATLRSDFEVCGEIDALTCLKDSEGRNKGIAFITFRTTDGVKAALEYDGEDYGGRTLAVAMASTRKASSKAKGKGKGGTDAGTGKKEIRAKAKGKGKGDGDGKGKKKGQGKSHGKERVSEKSKHIKQKGGDSDGTGIKQADGNPRKKKKSKQTKIGSEAPTE